MKVVLSEDVDVLLLEPSPTLQPPAPWLPVALPAFDWRPSVLLIGRDLLPRDRALIERTGVLERVTTLAQGLARLGEARWDVVVVSPSFVDETDGLRFVRAFKGSTALIGASEQLRQLRERYQRTPFVVQPLAGDTQFAVFNSATRWFLGSTAAVPLAEAILRCAASG
jgi:hypothetical protein